MIICLMLGHTFCAIWENRILMMTQFFVQAIRSTRVHLLRKREMEIRKRFVSRDRWKNKGEICKEK